MHDPYKIYPIIGNILMPYAANAHSQLPIEKVMLTVVVPEGTKLDADALNAKGFYQFHSGQIVQQDEGVEPVAVLNYVHETIGTNLTIFLAYMPAGQRYARASIIFQLSDSISPETLDENLRRPFKNGGYEKVFIEQQPGPTWQPEYEPYDLIFEKYRTVMRERQTKLYFRFPHTEQVRDSAVVN